MQAPNPDDNGSLDGSLDSDDERQLLADISMEMKGEEWADQSPGGMNESIDINDPNLLENLDILVNNESTSKGHASLKMIAESPHATPSHPRGVSLDSMVRRLSAERSGKRRKGGASMPAISDHLGDELLKLCGSPKVSRSTAPEHAETMRNGEKEMFFFHNMLIWGTGILGLDFVSRMRGGRKRGAQTGYAYGSRCEKYNPYSCIPTFAFFKNPRRSSRRLHDARPDAR